MSSLFEILTERRAKLDEQFAKLNDSENAKKAIVEELEGARARVTKRKEDLAAAREELDVLETKLQEGQIKVAVLTNKKETEQKRAEECKTKSDKLVVEAKKQQQTIDTLEITLADMKRNLKSKETELESETVNYDQALDKIVEANKELKTTTEHVDTIQIAVRQGTTQLKNNESLLKILEQEIVYKNEHLTKTTMEFAALEQEIIQESQQNKRVKLETPTSEMVAAGPKREPVINLKSKKLVDRMMAESKEFPIENDSLFQRFEKIVQTPDESDVGSSTQPNFGDSLELEGFD